MRIIYKQIEVGENEKHRFEFISHLSGVEEVLIDGNVVYKSFSMGANCVPVLRGTGIPEARPWQNRYRSCGMGCLPYSYNFTYGNAYVKITIFLYI